MTVNQFMRGILFPLGNAVFFAQADRNFEPPVCPGGKGA